MKLATFQYKDQIYVGSVSADLQTVSPFLLSPEQAKQGALAVIEMMAEGQALPAQGPAIALADVCLMAPLPEPRRNIFCVGKNYLDHVKEIKDSKLGEAQGAMANLPKHPVIFSKVPESVIGTKAAIDSHPQVTTEMDYEAELAVVIAKKAKGVKKENAASYIWGYTIINDVSARDLQAKHVQFHVGKSLDTFCPMGPWLVSVDELDANKASIQCWVNGELRQSGTTEQLIFDIPTIIENLSAGITLYPGDVIATGTPSGVGMGFKPPKFLKKGDTVKIEIAGIGVLENPVI
ncbi:MAG: FAA hydrolase family protein [Polynucleobacter sp.]|nr:MAG: FAA hydrolase family protein [Polynucleobacter sp.]